MKFRKIKLLALPLIGSSFFGISTFANADDLKISNATKYNLSFSINNTCSEEFGVVDKRSVKVIFEKNFKEACAYNPKNCQAKLYSKPYCIGKQVAGVVFDTTYGVRALDPLKIRTGGNGFNLFFEDPSLVK